jgi:hypothetical protein
MAFVFLTLAIGLAIAAWRAQEKITRLWCLGCCVLNAVAAIHIVASNHEYAWKLMPNDGSYEPAYRVRR